MPSVLNTRGVLVALAVGVAVTALANARAAPTVRYQVLYEAMIAPSDKTARVRIALGDGAHNVLRIVLRIDPERHNTFEGDGRIESTGTYVEWYPPKTGGELRYRFQIDHLRDERSYDARCTKSWALFRGDDLVPPARVLTEDGAHSVSRLRLRLPPGWSAVTPYRRTTGGDYLVEHAYRRFDRPTGWIALGDLGVLRERIDGVRVAVAAPRKHGVRRQDILAMLRWTLPELRAAVGNFGDRVLVVGAGDPMWRGGLSGPRSVYLHAERPLITSDGTSPLLHELAHSALGARSGAGGHWIVEGLAEYYSIELLRRTGTTSEARHAITLERLGEKAARESSRGRAGRATGVLRMLALDRELRSRSNGERGLDDVAKEVARARPSVTPEQFREMAEHASGLDLSDFFEPLALADAR